MELSTTLCSGLQRARPLLASYGSLVGTLNLPTITRVDQAFLAGQLPQSVTGLPPTSQIILTFLEYYYGDASYISAGYFDKVPIDRWGILGDVILNDQLAALLSPLYNDAYATLGSRWCYHNAEIRDYISLMPISLVDAASESSLVLSAEMIMPFNVNTLTNSDREDQWLGSVWRVNFWDTGLGFIANMTLADG